MRRGLSVPRISRSTATPPPLRTLLGAATGLIVPRRPATWSRVATTAGVDGSLRPLETRPFDQYLRAQELLRQGNFAGYGEEVKRLESVLKELRARAGR